MSSDDTPATQATAVADVSFVKLNPEHHAESSSLAESRSSKGNRSSASTKRYAETFLSPRDSPTGTSTERRSHDSTPRRSRKSGGFLLESVFANGHLRNSGSSSRHGKEKEHAKPTYNGGEHTRPRSSQESSHRSSPLTREMSLDMSSQSAERESTSRRPQAMDPAQLVQMALSLSESRKRHVSNVLPVPLSPAPEGRRVVSAVDSGYGTVKSSLSHGTRGGYLGDSAGHSLPHSRVVSQHADTQAEQDGENVLYTFSPATLSRAEKARRYFELASEHRRLLEHLPPLKTDATAPGNYLVQATSSPGTAHYDVTRIPSSENKKHKLGRSYNPLQALRNRRLRNRERRPLTAPPDSWQETDRIKQWVDDVAAVSEDPSYRPGDDLVHLPAFSGELEGDAQPTDGEATRRHRRSDTVTSVITRPENGWTIEPAELLADTYWLEKGDNKTVIEDRHGNRVFACRARLSVEVPRKSRESDRASQATADKYSQDGDVSDDERAKSRRKRILPIPTRLRRKHVSRSVSETSISSDDGRKPPALQYDNEDGGDENIGPLERHMRNMIAKDENGEMSSPELLSPAHWDSKHSRSSHAQNLEGESKRGSVQTANGRLSVDTQQHRRSRSAEGRVGSVDHAMSSMDEIVSDSPNSPEVAGFVSMNIPTSDSRQLPAEQRRRKHHLPFLRTRSKEREKVDRTDFADNFGTQLSPVLSADTASSGHPRSSVDSARPTQFRRQKTGESTHGSLKRTNTTGADSAKDSASFVGRRFLRAGRIGDLMRNESSRFGDRFRGSRERLVDVGLPAELSKAPSEASEAEDGPPGSINEGASMDGDQVSPRASLEQKRPRPKYYISNLPSFKSPSGRDRRSTIETPVSEEGDPFVKSRKGWRNDTRSTQPGHLAPPTIKLPDGDDDRVASDPDANTGRFGKSNYGRSYEKNRSTMQGNISQMPTEVPLSRRRGQNLDVGNHSKRHWSISDQAPPEQAHKVTNRDIARIRALLLASGIKAQEIYHRADTVREGPSTILTKAAQTAGKPVEKVPLKEEHIAAARMLSDSIRASLSDFDKTLQRFSNETAKNLGSQLEELSHRAGEQLTKLVNETSDEADAFNVQLTTKQPQEVKRVDEAVDAMFRQRRRQFRLLRRTGFKLLEWLVLVVLWWVWFCVVMFNTARKGVIGIVSMVRWLFWL